MSKEERWPVLLSRSWKPKWDETYTWQWKEWRGLICNREGTEGTKAPEEAVWLGVGTARTHEKGLHRFLLRMQRIISDAVTPFKAIWVVWASGSLYWSLKAASFIGAFVSSACSLYAVQNKRGAGGPAGVAPSLVSQEQLVRKAASLCYLLSNEGTISLVSDSSWLLSIFFSSRLFMKT